jgi:HAE1 family hydrophobic/amphiphilic exporter-1
LYRGLGAVVLGGLLLSTFFTLVLVPTLFSLMIDIKRALFEKSEALVETTEPVEFPVSEPEAELTLT